MAKTDYLPALQSFYRVLLGRPVDTQALQATAQALNAVGAPTTIAGLQTAYRTNADIKLIIDNQGTGPVVEKLLASFTAALGNVVENLGLGTLFPGLVPKAAQIGTPTASTVTEDTAVTTAGNLQVNGTIAITDPNPNQAAFQTTVTPAQGNLGQLVLAVNGSYTYAVANSAVQFLNAGQTQVDTFTVRSVDGTAKQVSFTIQGADEPFIPPTSPQIFTPATGSTSGAADASTALLLDARYILVGDDEGNALRVFDRAGGVAVKEISFGEYLGIGNNELDLEGSTRIGNTLYFIGSHGNSKAGADQNNREWIFSATATGTGADTTLAFTGKFNGLEAALVAWDSGNVHGKGANFFGFAASTAAGSPERNTGIGIEGLTASADGSALWIGFRSPVTGGAALNQALIVQVTNIDAVLAGTAAPVFGAPIELDLGGRGIRSIDRNADGQYLIIAGPTGNASADVADDFRLYTWDGSTSAGHATHLVQRAVALDGLLATGASFEAIVDVPGGLNDASYVQLLQDDGGVLVGGVESKDLPTAQQQFMGNFVQIGAAVVDTTAPLLLRTSPADNATDASATPSIVLTFNEPVRAGTGSFVLSANGAPVATIAATDAQVRYEYNTITLQPTNPLAPSTTYTLTFAPGVVVDAAGNGFAGLQGGNALDFTTAAGATIAGTTLAAGEVFFLAINTDDTDAFAFSFTKAIVAGTRIGFSDRDATGAGLPATGEAAYVWTADQNYAAGTIVTIQPGTATGSGNPTASHGSVLGSTGGLSATAETVYAFQGVDGGGLVGGIAGLGNGTAGAITAATFLASINAGGAAAGVIPASISAFAQTFSTDEAVYTGPLGGDTGALATAARNNANYFTSDTVVSPIVANRVVFPNHAPAGADASVTLAEDTPRSFSAADFGFTDSADDGAAHALQAVRITTLPGAGSLTLSGSPVTAGQTIAAASLANLLFTPAADASGTGYASFTFQVQDSGGTARGGSDLDPTPNTLTLHVTPQNDAPTLTSVPTAAQAVTAGTAAALADFTVADVDSPSLSVTLTTSNGSLGGLVDTDAGTAGIQLSGTPSAINTALAAATFTASAAGPASIGISVSDGQAPAVTGTYSFNAAPPPAAGATLVSAIQGAGDTSPLVGQSVTVQARVTAWLPNLSLFFVQEEAADQDNNALTSEGIAVFYGAGTSPVNAGSIGDVVRFQATVAEFNGLTELTTPSSLQVITDGTAASLDAAAHVTLPIASGTTLERYEGMLVEFSAASGNGLFVSDTFTYGRFGETIFHADAVPTTYTQLHQPSVEGNAAYTDFLARNSIILEDNISTQNPSLATLQADGYPLQRGGADLGPDNFIRVGDSTPSLTGVLSFGLYGSPGVGSYELQPTGVTNLTPAPRPAAPSDAELAANGIGAPEITVSSFNVLNYFTQFSGNFTTTAGNSIEVRGASNAAEFARQQAKVVEAIIGTGADVLGLTEIQNNGFADGASAIDNLVDALNAKAGAGTYAYIHGPYSNGSTTLPGAGSDAITVAIIYKPGVVQPLGNAVIPDTTVYTAYTDSNRVPVAQTFGYLTDASRQFTLVVDHLKSKGSVSTNFSGDADTGDGQGNNNPTRLEAAVDLARWLSTNPTGATDGDYLVVGDFNSYAQEDSVRFLTDTSFNAAAIYGGYDIPTAAEGLHGSYTFLGSANDYSYVFDGLRGSLDYAFARGLGSEVTGITHWNINADEQISLDYNTEFNPAGLYTADAYRSSDHDPVVIGLRLASEPGSPPPAPPPPPPAPPPPPPPAPTTAPGLNATVFINEVHYDNAGTDVLESISLAGPAGTDLSQYSIVRFNGGNASAAVAYTSPGIATPLPATIDDEGNGYGEVFIRFAQDGLQNGGSDGIGLLFNGQVVQLLSYEGVFTVAAGQGPFSGLTSTDIGVAEAGTEALVGGQPLSLQLTGSGHVYGDFAWQGATAVQSFGTLNAGQTLVAPQVKQTFSEDFQAFTAAGFAPVPAAGQLDSDLWRVGGFSDGATTFGGTFTNSATDFARGPASAAVATGGVFAFTVAAGNVAFGVQPTGSDFTAPGTLDLRLVNTTGTTVDQFTFDYDLFYRNDQARDTSVAVAYSLDGGANFTALAGFGFTTPAAAVAGSGFVQHAFDAATVTGLHLANGDSIVFRWSSTDGGSGSGNRDEIAVDNVEIELIGAGPDWSMV